MKNIKFILASAAFMFLLSTSSYAESKKPLTNDQVEKFIKSYVIESYIDSEDGNVMVISNFIVQKDKQNYAVEFMLDENDTITILSVKVEDEYYRVTEDYNAKFVQTYSFPVTTII